MKLLDILQFSEEYLKKYSFSKPRLESQKVISHVLNLDRITLYAYYDMELSLEQKEDIKNYLKKMARERKGFDEIYENEEKISKDYTNENREILDKSVEYLRKNGVKEAKLDAEYIFSSVLNVKRSLLSMNLRKKIEEESKNKIKEMLMERAKNKTPLQYILGEWEFYGNPFKVDKRVLIPRADTEILVEQCKIILEEMEKPKVLDIGTGSGAISISLAKEIKKGMFYGADISSDALEVAVINRALNKVENNLKFIKSDVFSNIKEKEFDMIISNPPYIPLHEYENLMPEVKLHEPIGALTDSGDGYYFYEKITKEAKDYLKDGGYIAYEVGYNQAQEVGKILEKEGYDLVAIVKDYGGIERVVIGRKSGEKNVD